ncbi:MAG: glycoside hydrolase family 15 protein [Verrucomicrobia bacterium]|nr:glycoside hydrolase family 15 protein [Verrucomicrobiota bacterium]
MNPADHLPISFPPIHRHGVIGDRRTGALVAADGTINWFCVPNFDGPPLFGMVLDQEDGGFCRFGPARAVLGRQRYLPETAALVTAWRGITREDRTLELTDLMAWPTGERPHSAHDQRVILRRLQAREATAVRFEVQPRWEFQGRAQDVRLVPGGATFSFPAGQLAVWASFPIRVERAAAVADLAMGTGDELWAVIGWNSQPGDWSKERATEVFEAAVRYWRDWSAGLKVDAAEARAAALRRSAITVHLLTCAEHDSAAAALTTSLPERIGGDRNYDYRFAWVRDASLSLALLAHLGKVGEVQCYLDWLCDLDSGTDAPLQVCYRLDGNTRLVELELSAVQGYADSRPVRYGNRAVKQRQLGSLAFFADCASIYLENDGPWKDKHWKLLRRAADYTCTHWDLPENGIWELGVEAHYVAGKVMSWVVLKRAEEIARRTGRGEQGELARWRAVADTIHAEVMDKGWNEDRNSFVQRYGSDALDAAALLIPLMEFLPAGHPRVTGTLAAIERELVIDGLVYRFEPNATLGGAQLPVGKFEGAFLPATFWFAHALAKAGRADEAEAILIRCEAIAGELGLFAEAADARRQTFLGNTPLLFAHVEYVRAAREVAEAKARGGIKDSGKEKTHAH